MTGPESPKKSDTNECTTKLNDLDFGHPLYLHPSDTSNASIINIKLKGTENYNIWSNALELSLQVKNKLGFIKGTVTKDLKDEVLGQQWERCNSVVLSWILNSVSEELYMGQIFSKMAKDVWDELKETYNKVDGSVIYNLYKQINSTTQNGMSISEYYHKLNSLWRQYDMITKLPKCNCSSSAAVTTFNEHLKLMQFLMGLDDVYQPLRSNLLSKDPLPTVKNAFAVISAEESHRFSLSVNTGSKQQASAFVSKLNDFNKNKINKTQALKCTYCNLSGHTVDKCFELVGYPANYKKKSNFQRAQSKSNSFSANATAKVDAAQPFSAEQIAKIISLIADKNPPVANMSGLYETENNDDW